MKKTIKVLAAATLEESNNNHPSPAGLAASGMVRSTCEEPRQRGMRELLEVGEVAFSSFTYG